MPAILPKLIVEYIGTFFLCIVIALSPQLGDVGLIAIATLLTGVIYGGGHVSKAHYNPAVSLAFFLQKQINAQTLILYILAQLLAACAAAVLAIFTFESTGDGTSAIASPGAGLWAELLGTFVLVWVILNVAIAKNTTGNQFYGIAIGFTVMGAAYVLGPYSGAAFNPAVFLSQSLAGFYAWGDWWIYLSGAVVGSVVAAGVFGLVEKGKGE